MEAHAFNEWMTVRDVRWYGREVFQLSLARNGMVFIPGDCLALFAADGRVSRPYSIASGIHDDVISFVIRHMPGGVVSSYLSSRQPGDAIRVSPPFGWFRPGEHHDKRPFVFVATGTGVAPFLSFLKSYADLSPAVMLYGCRKEADLIEPQWLRERARAHILLSRERVAGYATGRVTDRLDTLSNLGDADYYLCGLDTMIDDVTIWLEQRGVDIGRIHRECFFNASYNP